MQHTGTINKQYYNNAQPLNCHCMCNSDKEDNGGDKRVQVLEGEMMEVLTCLKLLNHLMSCAVLFLLNSTSGKKVFKVDELGYLWVERIILYCYFITALSIIIFTTTTIAFTVATITSSSPPPFPLPHSPLNLLTPHSPQPKAQPPQA